MKDEILSHLNDPARLEKLYRSDKSAFTQAFNALYPGLGSHQVLDFWNERLNFQKDKQSASASRSELVFVIIISLLAGLIAKLPVFLSIDEDFFYPRNIGFIVFPALCAYFIRKNKMEVGKTALIGGIMFISLIFINFLPNDQRSDTLVLSCIHLVLFLWSLLGFAFVGEIKNNPLQRLNYLKYNGDLIVMTTLILISGLILSGITVGLFGLIGFKIEQFYFEYIGVFGLAAAPLAATWLTRTNPQLVGKVSPAIARIFSPLVLIMLSVYLVAIIYSDKDPYNDREFLLTFNALLVGVMALIFFSVAESSATSKSRTEIWILFLLSVLTIIVNSIALSAILFRISEWGFTPNRTAVLGSNILILINLLLVTRQLSRIISNKAEIKGTGKIITSYLPVYVVWTIIVTFLFPLIFGFK